MSPKLLRDDASKDSERQPRRKDDERGLNKDYRSHYSRSSDSYKYSDHKSSRSLHGYSGHDDYAKHDKYDMQVKKEIMSGIPLVLVGIQRVVFIMIIQDEIEVEMGIHYPRDMVQVVEGTQILKKWGKIGI